MTSTELRFGNSHESLNEPTISIFPPRMVFQADAAETMAMAQSGQSTLVHGVDNREAGKLLVKDIDWLASTCYGLKPLYADAHFRGNPVKAARETSGHMENHARLYGERGLIVLKDVTAMVGSSETQTEAQKRMSAGIVNLFEARSGAMIVGLCRNTPHTYEDPSASLPDELLGKFVARRTFSGMIDRDTAMQMLMTKTDTSADQQYSFEQAAVILDEHGLGDEVRFSSVFGHTSTEGSVANSDRPWMAAA